MTTIQYMLDPSRIIDLNGCDKAEALADLCGVLAMTPQVTDNEALYKAIISREAIMSTGIGMGVAIPHAKIGSVSDFVMAVGLSKPGIDYQALDDFPVHLIVMIAASNAQSAEFLKILGKLGAFFIKPDNRTRLMDADDPCEIMDILSAIDRF